VYMKPIFSWRLRSPLVGSFDSALFEASVQDYNSIRPDFQASHMPVLGSCNDRSF
jgi:hypothetical protein